MEKAKNFKLKRGDFLKIDNVGVGKIESIYDDKDVNINILGINYYRDLETDKDVNISNLKEYIEFLKVMKKQITEQAKTKRKQAAEYNKSVDGMATKRKGKVSVIDGRIWGFCENPVSAHHRELLNDAKKAKTIKDMIKKELDYYKMINKYK